MATATGEMHDAHAGQAGGWLGGGRALRAAPFWFASRLVRFVQLAGLASYTQAPGGRAGRRASVPTNGRV